MTETTWRHPRPRGALVAAGEVFDAALKVTVVCVVLTDTTTADLTARDG